mgnify:CR=1 FL=1
MGCSIKWIAKRKLKIDGIKETKETTYSVMFDRIEAGTYLIAAALTEGNLQIKNVIPKIIKTEIDILKKIGAKIKVNRDKINIVGNKKIKNLEIKTAPYPGFPTDLQAQMMALMSLANGNSQIKENIFENRFMHVPELNRLGAKIRVKKDVAFISGSRNFKGAQVMASDLRASVSLVLAALCAEGESEINRVYHLDRGYEKIENTLGKLGPTIKREKY